MNDDSDVMTIPFRKGQSFPEHDHSYGKVLVGVSGILEVTLPGRTTKLMRGDSMSIPPNVPHAARGVTDGQVVEVALM